MARGGGVFSAISSEMQALSTEVQRANAQIAELGANLVDAIPRVSALAFRMEALTEEFSNRLTDSIRQVREEEQQMRENIMQVMQAGDRILAEVLARAGESLSHLQFQDSTAQGLLEIDRWLYDLEGRVAACLEVDVSPIPPLHMTIGGSSDYDPANAGELTLL
jgi:chromosome segregation ATPase